MNQIKNNTKEWFIAALIRAIKTMAQVMISMIGVGAAFSDVDWVKILSVAGVSGILSILTSIAGLPEVKQAVGTLNIDKTGEKDKYNFELGDNFDKIETENAVTLKVKVKE